MQILPLAAPGATLRPLFYLHPSNCYLHCKKDLSLGLRLLAHFLGARTPHDTCRNRGTSTQCETPLFWHKNNRALLFSKQHKHVVLVENPAKWLLGRQMHQERRSLTGRGAVCGVRTPISPHTHTHTQSTG